MADGWDLDRAVGDVCACFHDQQAESHIGELVAPIAQHGAVEFSSPTPLPVLEIREDVQPNVSSGAAHHDLSQVSSSRASRVWRNGSLSPVGTFPAHPSLSDVDSVRRLQCASYLLSLSP